MINPKYEYLREYVERIPKDFETIGTVIHSGRNLIKMITVDGLDINVKRYTIPPLINRIAYAFFRPSKGKRAFVYPEQPPIVITFNKNYNFHFTYTSLLIPVFFPQINLSRLS